MKKNLTLLMMLAAFVGILSAQSGPKFNYQAVVRNADTLVYNQAMTVTLTVTDGTNTYAETHDNVTTTKNGFLSVVVGEGTSNNQTDDLKRIDWSKATITAEFQYDTITLKSKMTVKPVPYAFQAGSALLTTERIASYTKNTLTSEGAKDILNALVVYNDDLQQALEDTIEVFLKANTDIAIEVAKAYLDSLKVADVQDAYNMLEGNEIATAKLKELVKEFVIQHRAMAKELAIYYLEHADSSAIARAYATAQQVPYETKQAVKNRVINYVKAHPALVENFGLYLIRSVSAQETAQAYAYFEQTNTNHVNEQLRDTLNIYIDKYLAAHSGLNGTVDAQKVNNAINNYLANHNVVKKCSTADVCVIDSLYKTYQQQNGGNNNNNNNNNNSDCTTCPQYEQISSNQVENGYRLSAKIDLSCGYVGQHFVVFYTTNNGEGQTEVEATYSNGVFSGVLTASDLGTNFGSVISIEFMPLVHVNCGSANGSDIEGDRTRIDLR